MTTRPLGGRRATRASLPRELFLHVVLLLVVALAAACGGAADGDDAAAPAVGSPSPTAADTGSPDAAFPVTVEAANGAVTIPTRPERIVSLSPTATEILFAIGAGDQVVAVDATSDHPPEAPTTQLSASDSNVEAIAEHDPDLVVVWFDPGEVVSGLEALDIPTLMQPAAASLDDTYAQIEQLGAATGHPDAAAELVADMRAEIDEVVEAAPPGDGLTYYHELDPTYYSVTGDTFIGQVYGLFGLESIADAAEGAESGYPQLSPEYIIEADPDVIFLADTRCCGVTPEAVAQRPGWDAIAAVRNDAIVPLDDSIASRWGPRVVELVRAVAAAVAAAPTPAATG